MANQVKSTIVLKINGKDVEGSFRGLRKEVKNLEEGLKKLRPGTEEFVKKAEELKEARRHFEKVKNEIDAVSGKLKESEGFLGKFRSKLSDIGLSFGNILVGLGGAGVSRAASELLKISDAMADVQKTTGMAREEVKQLWDAFDDMNTRTSKMDRLKIAEVGGRLGVPKEEMASFVQEVDKAYVALGDSFDGGLEGVVDSLGKIKGLFEETKGQSYADAINGVGSALNELAASGTASEGNISDFALRVGALPDALKPSIEKVLGLGAAFEESGVDSQIAASGYSNFMKVAGENLSAFAYSMNISVKEAQELFNTKPEEFFLKFAEGMRGLSADETAKVFDSLKINSLEVQKAVGAAANRAEGFRTAMDRAGEAMADATSLSEEFNKKNNNAAAVWEKIKNTIADTFTQTNFINFFEGIIFFLGNLVGVTNEAGNSVNTFKEKLVFLGNIIKVVVAGFVGYQAVIVQTALLEGNYTKAKWLGIVADKAQALAHSIKSAAITAYNGVLSILKRKTDQATASTAAFNTISKATPWGALVALITAAVTAYSLFCDEIDDAARKQKEFNDKIADAQRETAKEVVELDKLYKAATDASKGKQAQLKATEDLQKIYPDVFANIEKEIIMNGEAEKSYKSLRTAILNSAKAKAAKRMIEENAEKYAFKEGSLLSQEEKAKEEMEKAKKRKGKQTIEIEGQYFEVSQQEALNYYGAKLRSIEKQRKDLQKKQEEENKEYLKVIENTPIVEGKKVEETPGGGNRIAPDSTKKNKPPKNDSSEDKSKSAYEKSLEEKRKYDKELMDLQRKYEDEQEKIQLDSYEKEKRLLETQHKRDLEDIVNQNKEKQEAIAKVEREISDFQKAKAGASSQAQKNYDAAIQNKREEIAAINSIIAQNNKIKEQMEQTHQLKIKTIDEKAELEKHQRDITNLQKEAARLHEKNENEITEIKTMAEAREKLAKMKFLTLSNQELRNIHTLEDAKKALRENANRAALKAQIELFDKEQKILEKLLSNPNVFSEKEVQVLKERIASITTEMNKLNAVKKRNDEEDLSEIEKEARNEMGKVDILGFSVTQWSDTFKNLDTTERKLQAVMMGVQALKNAFSQFSELQQRLNERELRSFTKGQDNKKKELLRQLNEGYINQEQYHKGVQLLEEETDAKKAELANRQAKIQKAMAIAQIAINTAQAIIGIWAQVPKFDFGISAGVLTGVVSALGAAQIAAVLAQPDSFDKGGFTGSGFGSPDRTGFKPAGIVHENEYVTPKWMLENPVVADVVGWMESVRTGRVSLPKGYADGGIASEEKTIQPNNYIQQATTDPQLLFVLGEVKDLLENLKNNGVEAWMVENAENGKRLKSAIKQFENIEKRNARK